MYVWLGLALLSISLHGIVYASMALLIWLIEMIYL